MLTQFEFPVPGTSVAKCMHAHGRILVHTCTHISRVSFAFSEEIAPLASHHQLHENIYFSTHLFILFSCLRGRDGPFLHPGLSSHLPVASLHSSLTSSFSLSFNSIWVLLTPTVLSHTYSSFPSFLFSSPRNP